MVKLQPASPAMVNGKELAGATFDLASVAVVPCDKPSPAYPPAARTFGETRRQTTVL